MVTESGISNFRDVEYLARRVTSQWTIQHSPQPREIGGSIERGAVYQQFAAKPGKPDSYPLAQTPANLATVA
jgi:hypothetical protein